MIRGISEDILRRVYDFSEMTNEELRCKFFQKLQECIDLCNNTSDILEWIKNEGLEEEVKELLTKWLEDGTLEKLINDNLFLTKLDKEAFNKFAISVENYKNLVEGDDWTEAFKKAVEVATSTVSLYRRVYVPAGVYKVQGVILPSNIYFFGAGKDKTILKLIPGEKIDIKYKHCLVTNEDWTGGNSNIIVSDMTLDWNNAYANILKNPGSTSCLFANCENSVMSNLHACGGGLHGLDISNNRYNPYETNIEDGKTVYYELNADGNRTGYKINPTTYKRSYRSKNCKIINCSATGAIDDNITTHHSDLIVIENCVSYNPKGRTGGANTNCYEIDDGSTRVTVNNCYAFGGRCGFEIKGHQHSPAAKNVTLNNCTAENNVFSYRIRHIGHRSGEASESDLGNSATAFDVELNNCFAINPIRNEEIAPNVTPNALKLYAYRNVNINNFTCIGGNDGIDNGVNDGEDTDNDLYTNKSEVIRITTGGRYINLNNINIKDFKNCEQAILVSGGGGGSKVNMSNISILNSGRKGIELGDNTYALLNNIRIERNDGLGEIGIEALNYVYGLSNCYIDGYPIKSKINEVEYNTTSNRINGGIVLASGLGHATTENSVVLSSTAGATASGNKSIVIASSEAKATGDRSAVICCSSGSTEAKGGRSAIISSSNSIVESGTNGSMILASNGVVSTTSNSISGGYNTGSSSEANKSWQIESMTGNIKATGTITGSSSFADFAEMFENKNHEEIATGTIVALDDDKVVKANGDDILGVISKTALVIAGDSSFTWQGRYLKDEFGGLIYEEQEIVNENGEVEILPLPVENKEYDINRPQVARSERKKEWSCVGLIGQVYTRIDETVNAGDYLKAIDGIGSKSDIKTNLRVMKITKEFDGNYGVALCILK